MHLNHGVVVYLPKVVSDYDFCPRKLKKYTLHYEQVLLTVSLESLLCTYFARCVQLGLKYTLV